jgi:hypothetical protein
MSTPNIGRFAEKLWNARFPWRIVFFAASPDMSVIGLLRASPQTVVTGLAFPQNG